MSCSCSAPGAGSLIAKMASILCNARAGTPTGGRALDSRTTRSRKPDGVCRGGFLLSRVRPLVTVWPGPAGRNKLRTQRRAVTAAGYRPSFQAGSATRNECSE